MENREGPLSLYGFGGKELQTAGGMRVRTRRECSGRKNMVLRSFPWVTGTDAVFTCLGKAPRVRYGFRGSGPLLFERQRVQRSPEAMPYPGSLWLFPDRPLLALFWAHQKSTEKVEGARAVLTPRKRLCNRHMQAMSGHRTCEGPKICMYPLSLFTILVGRRAFPDIRFPHCRFPRNPGRSGGTPCTG